MKKGGLFKTIRVFVVILIALVFAVVLVVLRPKAERQVPVDKGLLVEVLPAKAENINMVVESFGTVAPRESLKLVAQVRGPIVDIDPAFKEGGFVQKNTRLIQIDPRTYRLEVGLHPAEHPRFFVDQSPAAAGQAFEQGILRWQRHHFLQHVFGQR